MELWKFYDYFSNFNSTVEKVGQFAIYTSGSFSLLKIVNLTTYSHS